MKAIIYCRVSTKRQFYGLEAQREQAERFILSRGGEVAAVYKEQESGKNDARPELARAITHCKEIGATLVIAKLDRLSRNVSFLFDLRDKLQAACVNVIAADMPEVLSNTLTLAVMAGMAQHERELISARTKAGLEVARQKGRTGGRAKGCDNSKSLALAHAASKVQADERAAEVAPIVCALRKRGVTLAEIAQTLNKSGHITPRGKRWTPKAVSRVIKRIY